MKRMISLLVISALVVGVSFAQGRQREQQRQRTPREIETMSVSGKLKLEKGIVAVESGENTYLVPMLNRYIGFIVGLQEGKTVSVEGFNHNRNDKQFLRLKKLTIEGKDYEFPRRLAYGEKQRHFAPNRRAPQHPQQPQRQRQRPAPNRAPESL